MRLGGKNINIRKEDLLYGGLLWSGLILELFAVDLFRKTFMPQALAAGIYIGAGLLGFIFLRKKIAGMFKIKIVDVIVSLAFCMFAFGGNLSFLFLAANYFTASQNTKVLDYPIGRTGRLGGGLYDRNTPYAVIEEDGYKKEIFFKGQHIDTLQVVRLTVSKGGLGFNIIRKKQLRAGQFPVMPAVR